jgi:hypothetical protein
VPDAVEPLVSGDLALFAETDAVAHAYPVVRHLHHLADTLGQVAQAPSLASSAR